MKSKTPSAGESSASPHEPEFSDPASKPWVWAGYALLFFALLPIWPIPGNWWGVPAWAVFAVLVSALTSVFTAFVILGVWKDSDVPFSGRDDGHD
jgi:fatty acid desaturase